MGTWGHHAGEALKEHSRMRVSSLRGWREKVVGEVGVGREVGWRGLGGRHRVGGIDVGRRVLQRNGVFRDC